MKLDINTSSTLATLVWRNETTLRTIERNQSAKFFSVKKTVYIYIFALSFLPFLFSSWNCRVIIDDLQERETKDGNGEREGEREGHGFSFSRRIFSVKLTVGNPNGSRVIARVSRGNDFEVGMYWEISIAKFYLVRDIVNRDKRAK